MKICVEDRAQDLLDSFSEEAAVQDLFVRLSVQGVYKISTEDLCKRSQSTARSKISALFTWSLVSVQDLYKRSPGKISAQDLYKSSAGKFCVEMSIRGLLARSL